MLVIQHSASDGRGWGYGARASCGRSVLGRIETDFSDQNSSNIRLNEGCFAIENGKKTRSKALDEIYKSHILLSTLDLEMFYITFRPKFVFQKTLFIEKRGFSFNNAFSARKNVQVRPGQGVDY